MSNIETIWDDKNSKRFRTSCNCGDTKCGICIDIEYCKDTNMVEMILYCPVSAREYFGYSNFFSVLWGRIKLSLKVLFLGEIELEGVFYFRGQEQINEFADALKDSAEKVKEGVEKERFDR